MTNLKIHFWGVLGISARKDALDTAGKILVCEAAALQKNTSTNSIDRLTPSFGFFAEIL
jgi:hypothetical protein